MYLPQIHRLLFQVLFKGIHIFIYCVLILLLNAGCYLCHRVAFLVAERFVTLSTVGVFYLMVSCPPPPPLPADFVLIVDMQYGCGVAT